jgi:hypothetical protein
LPSWGGEAGVERVDDVVTQEGAEAARSSKCRDGLFRAHMRALSHASA